MLRESTVKLLQGMFATFGKQIDKPTLETYDAVFGEYSTDILDNAIRACIANCQFLPKPADVMNAVKRVMGLDDDTLELKCIKVLDVLNEWCKCYTTLVFSDYQMCWAFTKAFDSVQSFCRSSNEAEQLLKDRKQLLHFYKLAVNNNIPKQYICYPHTLSGKSYLFIGNKERCKDILLQTTGEIGCDMRDVYSQQPETVPLIKCEPLTDEEYRMAFDSAMAKMERYFGNVK